jgi:hypothetical protein
VFRVLRRLTVASAETAAAYCFGFARNSARSNGLISAFCVHGPLFARGRFDVPSLASVPRHLSACRVAISLEASLPVAKTRVPTASPPGRGAARRTARSIALVVVRRSPRCQLAANHDLVWRRRAGEPWGSALSHSTISFPANPPTHALYSKPRHPIRAPRDPRAARGGVATFRQGPVSESFLA